MKQDTIDGHPLQWIQPVDAAGEPAGDPVVAVDPIGLGPDEYCYYITSREASLTLWETFAAVDAGIVGKVDRIDMGTGQGRSSGAAGGAGRAVKGD